jgi:hypothetical protein
MSRKQQDFALKTPLLEIRSSSMEFHIPASSSEEWMQLIYAFSVYCNLRQGFESIGTSIALLFLSFPRSGAQFARNEYF